MPQGSSKSTVPLRDGSGRVAPPVRCGYPAVMRLRPLGMLILLLAVPVLAEEAPRPVPKPDRWSSFLPLMGDEARKLGIELPLPFGAGLVFYHLSRDIEVTDLRVGRNGASPVSVSDFARLGARAD